MKYLSDFKAMILWILIVVNTGVNFLGFQTTFNEIRLLKRYDVEFFVEVYYYYTTGDEVVLYDVTHPIPYKFKTYITAEDAAQRFVKAEQLKNQADSVIYKIKIDNGYNQ